MCVCVCVCDIKSAWGGLCVPRRLSLGLLCACYACMVPEVCVGCSDVHTTCIAVGVCDEVVYRCVLCLVQVVGGYGLHSKTLSV